MTKKRQGNNMKVCIPDGIKDTPLMRISLLLTMGIITATYSYDYLGTAQWLLLAGISLGAAFITRKLISSQCLSLYLCIFFLSCTFTAHQIDKRQLPTQYITQEELSSFDRTILRIGMFRKAIEQKMKDLHIEEQDYAVVSAMALGDKSALDKETKDSYSIAGTSHVLAVSGLHIGIIFQLFLLMLKGNRNSWAATVLSITAIWAYVLFIGMPNSAMRSATMISIYCFALLARRQGISLNTLAFAYVIMLLINPQNLYDISFQMSFLAVASILLFYPLLNGLLHPHRRITRWGWQLLCMSASAQLGTMPLIVYYFGRISCYSLLTSFIAIPSATLVLYLCALLLFLSPFTLITYIAGFADTLIQFTANILTSVTQFTNTFFRLTSLLPGASIEGISISLPLLSLLYLALFASYLLVWKLGYISQRVNHYHAHTE
ncbi:MAG TPA: hypothetical protein DDW28_01155 [Prevotella sp.]|nr:ComEC/Rec2 family competence protein [uncultured Prevotella sp.]HBF04762.1 hypothetical protein [Candidatus Segatella violae]